MTPQGEVNILPYNSGGAFNRGLIDGWKEGYCEAMRICNPSTANIEFIEFIEAGEE